jgi:hypothetical protein
VCILTIATVDEKLSETGGLGSWRIVRKDGLPLDSFIIRRIPNYMKEKMEERFLPLTVIDAFRVLAQVDFSPSSNINNFLPKFINHAGDLAHLATYQLAGIVIHKK